MARSQGDTRRGLVRLQPEGCWCCRAPMGAAEDLPETQGPVALAGAGGLARVQQAPAGPSLSVGQIERDRHVPRAYQTLGNFPSLQPAACWLQFFHPTPSPNTHIVL